MGIMATEQLLQRGAVRTGYRLSTASQSFERVRRGEDPWIALGDFLDDWRRAEADQRALRDRAGVIGRIASGQVGPVRSRAKCPDQRTSFLCSAAIFARASPADFIAPPKTPIVSAP